MTEKVHQCYMPQVAVTSPIFENFMQPRTVIKVSRTYVLHNFAKKWISDEADEFKWLYKWPVFLPDSKEGNLLQGKLFQPSTTH